MNFRYLVVIFILISYSIYAQENNCDNCIDDDGDGLIDCYDPDCSGNSSCDNFFIRSTTNSNIYLCDSITDSIFYLKEFWQRYQVGIEDSKTPVVGDIDNDGIPEIITRYIVSGTDYYLSLLNGQTGIPNNILLPYKIASEMAIGDIDKDGFGEIICFTDFAGDWALTCLEHDGSQKWRNTTNFYTSTYAPYPSLADFDADGIPEVYIGNKIFNTVNGSLIVSGAGSKGKINGGAGSGYDFSTAADVLPDNYCTDCNGLELICGNQVYAVDITGAQLTIVSTAPGGLLDGFTSVADMDNDDSLDIIVNMYQSIYIWNPRTAIQLGNTFPLIVKQGSIHQGGIPNLGNLDADPEPEIGIASDSFYVVINYDQASNVLTEFWKNKVQDITPSITPASTMFDLDCNNELEIIFRDRDSLYIINGATGKVLSSKKCLSGTLNERPVVADVDNDGHAEIVCGCRDGSPGFGFHVFKNTYNSWTATRTVMNQQNYFATHINDDLTIACNQQNHATTLPVLNSYLNQIPIINYDENRICYDLVLAPDPDMTIDSIIYRECAWDSSFVYVTICNNKFGNIPSGIPVSLYKNDPVAGFSYFKTEYLTSNIAALNCLSTKISIEGGPYILYVVVNDTGSDFASSPNTLFEECDILNNTDSIFVAPLSNLIWPELNFVEDTTICGNETLELDAGSVGQTYTWSTNDTTQILIVSDTGLYWVAVRIDSCIYTDSINVHACVVNDFFIPNAFSPDGDGFNDYFKIITQGNISISSLKIYDQWGTLLFQTTSNESWDGTFNDSLLPSGIYIYALDLELNGVIYTTVLGNIFLVH